MTDHLEVTFDDVPLSAIRIDGGTQARTEIDQEVVAEYAEAMRQGEVFPPLVVFFDGAEFWLADGFHRYHAHQLAGAEAVRSEIHTGLLDDAKLHAAGANRGHGLRRSNADKRNAVKMVLAVPRCAQWSDREIARQCGVGNKFVGDVRASICVPNTDSPASATRTVTRNGTTYEQKVKARPAPAQKNQVSPANLIAPGNPVSPADGIETTPTIATPRLTPEQGAVAVAEVDALVRQLAERDALIAELREELDDIKADMAETLDDNNMMTRVFEADDQVAASMIEVARFRAVAEHANRTLAARAQEYNERARLVGYWKKRAEKAEKALGWDVGDAA